MLPNVNRCYDSIPRVGLKNSSEGVRQGTGRDVASTNHCAPQLYVGNCPSISEGKVRGSEVDWKFGGSEVSLKKSEKHIRDVCHCRHLEIFLSKKCSKKP